MGLRVATALAVLWNGTVANGGQDTDRPPVAHAFVWPGHGVPRDRPAWGHRDGLRIGVAPTPGPRGLIRVYTPYLDQPYPRVVNYLSIEPLVRGEEYRAQSELAASGVRPGRTGLHFEVRDHLRDDGHPDAAASGDSTDAPAQGVVDGRAGTLRLFVHTETFPNGARPVIEIVFRREDRHEIELVLHAAPDSQPLARCTVSATMGNYGQLRRLHLRAGVAAAADLWPGSPQELPLDRLGFLPWRTWPADRLVREPDGRLAVAGATDAADPAGVRYDRAVPDHWRYRGRPATHHWRAEADARPELAVNGRVTYWRSAAAIPGGPALENFELRLPFRDGRRLWFAVRPVPAAGRPDPGTPADRSEDIP